MTNSSIKIQTTLQIQQPEPFITATDNKTQQSGHYEIKSIITKNETPKLKSTNDEFLPPTNLQPYIQLQHGWYAIGGLPNDVNVSPMTPNDSGSYIMSVGGLTTAWNRNPNLTLGLEYREWDLANSAKRQQKHIYQQIGPSLNISGQYSRYRVTDHSYEFTVDPSSVEKEITDSSYDAMAAVAAGNYGGLTTIFSQMFDDIELDDTARTDWVEDSFNTSQWRLESRLATGNAIYRAEKSVSALERFDLGITGTMTGLDEHFLLGIGIFADSSLIRVGRNPRMELGAEGLIRYHTNPSSSNSYMIETGMGLNFRTSFNLRRHK